MLDLMRQMKQDIPLIFLVKGMKRETAAEFILKGAADCIEADSIGHLPVAVHRALAEKTLRDQRDRAEKQLRHSQARYRALAADGGARNLTFHQAGIEAALEMALPQFDYVVVHGIYSWVPLRERGLVLAFLRRFLNPLLRVTVPEYML